LPTFADFDETTGIFEFSPDRVEQVGTYQVKVEVTDGRSRRAYYFKVTVLEENPLSQYFIK
jgi:hypothetical protein